MSQYIEVSITLDSLDLVQIETLIERRIADLKELKRVNLDAGATEDGFIVQMANEHIRMFKQIKKKISDGRKEVARVKTEADAAYYKSLRTRKRPTAAQRSGS